MTKIIYLFTFIVSNITSIFFGFRLGIKTEQRARLRRLNALKKILNGKV
jgi:hypothetical protein